MRVRWTDLAHADLAELSAWLHERNPAAALRVARQVVDAAASLETLPYRFREGRVPGTRECTVRPYVLIYEIEGDEVRMLRCLHGRRLWPIPDA